jgi:hypothetical protein
MYISNVADNDGILKYSNYRKYHPYTNRSVAEVYKREGEVTFLTKYQNESLAYLRSNPGEFINKIINRSYNIFIFAKSERDIEPARVDLFNPQDVKSLESAGLLVDGYWVCLEYTPVEFDHAMDKLTLNHPKVVSEDWNNKAATSIQRVNNLGDINELIKGLSTSIIPTIGIVFGLLVPAIRTNLVFIFSLLLFLLSIGPYLVISWTPRYQSFQIGFFSIFIFMMIAQIMEYIHYRKREDPCSITTK